MMHKNIENEDEFCCFDTNFSVCFFREEEMYCKSKQKQLCKTNIALGTSVTLLTSPGFNYFFHFILFCDEDFHYYKRMWFCIIQTISRNKLYMSNAEKGPQGDPYPSSCPSNLFTSSPAILLVTNLADKIEHMDQVMNLQTLFHYGTGIILCIR